MHENPHLLAHYRLLGTFGGDNVPCCGFGFGDAVIVELLKERNKMPVLKHEVRLRVCVVCVHMCVHGHNCVCIVCVCAHVCYE
jgi:histidyl-tRNA synthetase